MNHYVQGIPLQTHSIAEPQKDIEWAKEKVCEMNATPNERSLAEMSLRAGFAVQATVTDGNCGIDCMCRFEGRLSTPNEFWKIRNELADHIDRHAHEKLYQDCFVACQEFLPPPAHNGDTQARGGNGDEQERGTIGSCGSGGLGGGMGSRGLPIKLQPLVPIANVVCDKTSATALDTALAIASATASATLASATIEDREKTCGFGCLDLVTASASAMVSEQSQIIGKVQTQTFGEYMRQLGEDKQQYVCRDYFSYMQMEKEWCASIVPKKTKRPFGQPLVQIIDCARTFGDRCAVLDLEAEHGGEQVGGTV